MTSLWMRFQNGALVMEKLGENYNWLNNPPEIVHLGSKFLVALLGLTLSLVNTILSHLDMNILTAQVSDL